MIKIQITPEIREAAKKKAASVGVLQGSITGSQSNEVGCIGEIIVAEYAGATIVNNPNYDLILDKKRIDVKTKRCNTPPRTYYDCSVSAHGSKQKCDSYVFVRILTDLSCAWILGEISKEDFYKKAIRYNRGDLDIDNGYIFKADCYNLKIGELNEVLAL